MKFKNFLKNLNESPSYFRGIDEMISQSRVPITSKLSKLLGFEQKVKDIYHCTELHFLKDLKQIEHTKNQISTFTKGLSNLLHQISTRPDVMVVLNGTVVMPFDHDIFSHPDKQGRRWISTRGHPKSEFLDEAINIKVIKKMLEMSGENLDPYEIINDDFRYKKIFESLDKKQKKELIQMYFDRIHKIFSNKIYSKILKEIISINKRDTQYNELIVNDFTIKGCYSLENGKYIFNHESAKDDIEKYKIKYLGFLSRDDFKNF